MVKSHTRRSKALSNDESENSLIVGATDYDENTLWGAHEGADEFLVRDTDTFSPKFSHSPSEREAFGDADSPRSPRSLVSDEETPWWRLACRHRLLSADEEKLFAARIQSGDEEALVLLVESNYRLVIRIAGRYQRLRSRTMTLEDLFQEGCIGLMHAARKFDPKRGVRFSTYAVPWVQQCMARAIIRQERLVRLPEGLEREQQTVERTVNHLTHALGRRPSRAEVASSLSESSRPLLDHPVNFDFISLDSPISPQNDSDSWADIVPDEYTNTANDAIDRATREVMRAHICQALRGLTDQQATVIRLRYGLDGAPKTLVAIAGILDVTPERVRQLERSALRNMRRSKYITDLQKDELIFADE